MQRVNQFSLFGPISSNDDDWTFNGASRENLPIVIMIIQPA